QVRRLVVSSVRVESSRRSRSPSAGSPVGVLCFFFSGRRRFRISGSDWSSVVGSSWRADGRRLVTAGEKSSVARNWGAVKLWDAATGQPLLVLRGPDTPFALAWSRDSHKLAAQCFRDSLPVYTWAAPRRPH